jgi:cardiolipin synthase
LATALLFYAGLTDLVDGWIARKYNLKSVVGTIIDPMADKFLMITLTGALAYTGAMPGPPIQ